jgi:hypothetical protein
VSSSGASDGPVLTLKPLPFLLRAVMGPTSLKGKLYNQVNLPTFILEFQFETSSSALSFRYFFSILRQQYRSPTR